jgi:hypothetical protein
MHPLTPNLRELSDNDLNEKFRELSNKLNAAYRMGNAAMVQQIQMILEDYQQEVSRRQQKAYEEMMNKGGMFDGIIKVKK